MCSAAHPRPGAPLRACDHGRRGRCRPASACDRRFHAAVAGDREPHDDLPLAPGFFVSSRLCRSAPPQHGAHDRHGLQPCGPPRSRRRLPRPPPAPRRTWARPAPPPAPPRPLAVPRPRDRRRCQPCRKSHRRRPGPRPCARVRPCRRVLDTRARAALAQRTPAAAARDDAGEVADDAVDLSHRSGRRRLARRPRPRRASERAAAAASRACCRARRAHRTGAHARSGLHVGRLGPGGAPASASGGRALRSGLDRREVRLVEQRRGTRFGNWSSVMFRSAAPASGR
jgi:hypothetical protein